MTIRYDPGYNAEIRRVVQNFNRKRARAYAKGFRDLPDIIKVSDLKARYETRSELNKELRMLKRFSSRKDVLRQIENQGGAKAISWEFNYLKQNVKRAREFYLKQYQTIAKKVGRFPGERMQLDTISAKLNLLEMDLNYMNQEQFRSYKATINEYLTSGSRKRAGYRGFLSEVLNVMRMVGINEDTINRVMNKVNELTADQFFEMYNDSDLVSRIYDLADSPIYGELKLNTDRDTAEDLINTFVEEVDDLVETAKQPKQEYDPLNEFMKSIGKEKTPRSYKNKKIPRSQLTDRDIEMLEALGGTEGIVDETK